MNHLKYLDMFMEEVAEERWATVKNIKLGTEVTYKNTVDNTTKPIVFSAFRAEHVGERMKFEKSPVNVPLWYNVDIGKYYHPDWLDFEDEDEQINLFSKD